MIDTSKDVPAAVVAVEVGYEVHLRSNGAQTIGFEDGTWFQPSGLIGKSFPTVDDAQMGVREWSLARRSFSWLPYRIVQVTTVATVVYEEQR